jgi:hydrogenase small subunit
MGQKGGSGVKISRRSFLWYCGSSAAALGLGASDLLRLEKAVAAPGAPTVVWLQGSACTGCSVSLLNRISTEAPRTAGDLLIESIDLAYHPNLMAAAGESAVECIDRARSGAYVLAVEGAVPTAFGGSACWAWSRGGSDVTFQQAVTDLAQGAVAILSIGTCASWGGMAAAAPNPTLAKGVGSATGKSTINIAGCPPHPDWIVWTVAQLLLGKTITLDGSGRPRDLFGRRIHEICPRRGRDEVGTFAVDELCLKGLGCRGPQTMSECSQMLWNGGQNWCIDANAPCLGCTSPGFPGATGFYQVEED